MVLDEESGVPRRGQPQSPPRSNVRFSSSSNKASQQSESPGVRTVGSDTTQGLSINHSFSNSTSRGGGLAGMSKPVMALVGLVFFGTAGAAAFGWFQIPGLQNQIKDLEAQVTRLESEVDRLSTENDRYESLNNELNGTVAELKEVNQAMKVQLDKLENEVGRLEAEVDEFQFQNERYESINSNLNRTVDDLGTINNNLSNTTTKLEESILQLNSSLADLNNINENLSDENDRLAELNDDLQTIGSFLNTTANELDRTFEEVSTFLAEQIVVNRQLVLQALEISYQQRVSFWDCDYRDFFRTSNFTQDENMPIGNALPVVLAYVDERVLTEVCADETNFEQYLENMYGLDSLTSNELFEGTSVYLTRLMNYYFPDDGETGMSLEEWANADYRCGEVRPYMFP